MSDLQILLGMPKKAQEAPPLDSLDNPATFSDNYANDFSYAMDSEDMVVVEDEGSPDDGHEQIMFVLPEIPGADDDSPIVVEEPASLEVAEEEPVEVEEPNPWDWQSKGLGNFLGWLKGMMEGVPRHSGRDTSGLERAVAYFQALEKEISKAMRMDFKSEISAAHAEEARSQILDGIDRMVDRLEKLNASKYKRGKTKKAEEELGLVKEANKAPRISGIVISVPLLISRLARVCINGMVSGGHDIEDTFHKLAKEYELTKREKAELEQLIIDMGYLHSSSVDRGFDLDHQKEPTSPDQFDFGTQFPG